MIVTTGSVMSLVIVTAFVPVMPVVLTAPKVIVTGPVPFKPHWADTVPVVTHIVLVLPSSSEYQQELIPLYALAEIENDGALVP